jgi:hypothetical protein
LRPYDVEATRASLQYCTYLQDTATNLYVQSGNDDDWKQQQQPQPPNQQHKKEPIVVYGSPWTPTFFHWAFNLDRGQALQDKWSQIPNATDVLITHGPPQGRGDMTLHSGHFGCQNLLHEIQQRIKPRLHIYGHIHEGYGTLFDGQTLYVNASNLDIGYEAIHPCIVIDLPHDQSLPAMVVQPHCPIQDLHEFVGWLQHKNYLVVAKALETCIHQRYPPPLPDLSSPATYRNLCAMLGWTRTGGGGGGGSEIRSTTTSSSRSFRQSAKRELRTALCQLYAESF